ncbi:something about silencing protein 10 [Mycoemilia scoparia]|uniref:Something about silencing protein 10 n=1 Tax=Mycoemilia scoparia TaxID=417184 RepID=A0A9W7ZUJ6_9FUNG|nr:something about silencing protein 10 [Mycoemilia scoparia]
MGKKRGQRTSKKTKDIQEVDPRDAKIKAINTWDDVEKDSEDEFHASRDKVLLDYDKRLRNKSHESESEEEVFGVGSDDYESEQSDEEESQSSSGENDFFNKISDGEDEIGKNASWGTTKSAYYDADEVLLETDDEEAAKEEELEATKLQRQRLEELHESDFADEVDDDDDETQDAGAARLISTTDDAESKIDINRISMNVGETVDISEARLAHIAKMKPSEKLKVLKSEAPEFLGLVSKANELSVFLSSELHPLLLRCRERKDILPSNDPAYAFLETKYQLIMSYLSNIAFYLALKASHPDQLGGEKLRDHQVIATIATTLQKLDSMESIEEALAAEFETLQKKLDMNEGDETDEDSVPADLGFEAQEPKKTKKKSKKAKKTKSSAANGDEEDIEYEEEYSALKSADKKRSGKRRRSEKVRADVDDDFGELNKLGEIDTEEKKARHSLRHYASKVLQSTGKKTQKAKYSGDQDVPYKDPDAGRFRLDKESVDKVAKEAMKRGDDLGGSSDDNFADLVGSDADEDYNEYYQSVKKARLQEKEKKTSKFNSERENKWRNVLEENLQNEAALPADRKRKINYQILKNKGLIPKRSKEQRNPRVKRRMRYEKAQKKLGSQVRLVKKLDGHYGGEETGIKSRLSRSVKLG